MRHLGILLSTLLYFDLSWKGVSGECQGDYDLYFVIDSSQSAMGIFTTSIVPFVESISGTFTNQEFRLSYITFSSENAAVVQMPLTKVEDAQGIQEGIDKLKMVNPGGLTFLSSGLQLALSSIRSVGESRLSIIIVITDGSLSDEDASYMLSDTIKELGAVIMGVGVGRAVSSQLKTLASKDAFTCHAEASDLTNMCLLPISNKACIEITTITSTCHCSNVRNTKDEPSQRYFICRILLNGSQSDVFLEGTGFNKFKSATQKCRFTLNGVTKETTDVQVNRSMALCANPCLSPGNWIVDVSFDGKVYVRASEVLTVQDCSQTGGLAQSDATGLGVGLFFLFLILILAVVGLLLLWFFLPFIRGKIAGGLPPEEPEKEPPARPPKKWATVDASLYGGGGAGGIKPVKVQWGDKGATEEGNKLEKAKDAKVVSTHITPGYQPPAKPTPTCWEIFRAKVIRAYRWISSYRVYRGRTTRFVWCPGPN